MELINTRLLPQGYPCRPPRKAIKVVSSLLPSLHSLSGGLAAPYENGEHEHSDERRAEKIIIILNSVLPAKFLALCVRVRCVKKCGKAWVNRGNRHAAAKVQCQRNGNGKPIAATACQQPVYQIE